MRSAYNPVQGVPLDTYLAARQIYNIQHIYLRIGDEMKTIQSGLQVDNLALFPGGIPDLALRLALVTAFQYAEELTDSAAADATTRRMDWKYALYLPVKHPGTRPEMLCDFRRFLFSSHSGLAEFKKLLASLAERGLFARTAEASLDPTLALISVCRRNRLALLREAMKAALASVSQQAPEWMRANTAAHWYERYKTGRLTHPAAQSPLDPFTEASTLGADIYQLLSRLRDQNLTDVLEQPELQCLQRLWNEQFYLDHTGFYWRSPGCAGCTCNRCADSPH
jgi:hypothetical protein